jgi:hypothetical protein
MVGKLRRAEGNRLRTRPQIDVQQGYRGIRGHRFVDGSAAVHHLDPAFRVTCHQCRQALAHQFMVIDDG